MKRTFTLALGLVIGAAFASTAFAQDAFPDTPENHWAYEALANMRRAGLLVGYPDGLYRGSRPASRYEMAVALHALYQHFKGITDGFDARIKAIEGAQAPSGGVSQAEFNQLKDMVIAMQKDMEAMKGWGDDIANLKRMASTFEKELASMGVDIEALKKGVNDLANRVSALEKRKPAVDIHGDIGLFMLGGYSTNDNYGITVSGRPVGVSNGTGAPASIARDLNVFHEGHVVMTDTADEGPDWKAVLAIGNMLNDPSFSTEGSGDGGSWSQSHTYHGIPVFDGNDASIYFQEFYGTWNFGVAGQTGMVRVGRQGNQLGKYFYKRPDTTPYYSNEYWDNGDWMQDGVTIGFDFGGTSLTLFGGRTSDRQTNNGDEIQSLWAGATGLHFNPGGFNASGERPRGLGDNLEIRADTAFGAQVKFNLGKANVALNGVMLNQDFVGGDGGPSADRVVVFGGEVGFNIGSWMLNAGYSQSNVNLGDTNVVDEDNGAWWAGIGTQNDQWGLNVGFRHIDPLFAAPGDWGRIGIWWNPSDIEGFWVKGNWKFNNTITLHGAAEMYSGSGTDVDGATGFSEDDDVASYKLDLVFNLSDQVTAWLGYERVEWDLASIAPPGGEGGFTGGEPEETWWNLGFRYRMTDKAFWTFRWQVSDYDSKGVAGWNPFPSFFSGDSKAQGGLITSTLGIKF